MRAKLIHHAPMKRTSQAVPALLTLALGCADEPQRDLRSGGQSSVLLQIQPSDLASNIADTPVRVILMPWGSSSYVTTALVQQVSTMISAESNGSEVLLDVELEIDNALDSPNRESSPSDPTSLLIRPRDENWPASWVRLSVGPLSPSLTPSAIRTVNGYAVSRFAVDSRPVIRGFELCPKPGEVLRVLVHFSEEVDFESVRGAITVSQEGASCDVLPEVQSTPSTTLECRAFLFERPFTFEMLAGLRAASGLAVETYDGQDSVRVTAIYNDLATTQTGCRGNTF